MFLILVSTHFRLYFMFLNIPFTTSPQKCLTRSVNELHVLKRRLIPLFDRAQSPSSELTIRLAVNKRSSDLDSNVTFQTFSSSPDPPHTIRPLERSGMRSFDVITNLTLPFLWRFSGTPLPRSEKFGRADHPLGLGLANRKKCREDGTKRKKTF